MFNYLFPIFCFGLVMTGIVFLGIIEAAKQLKSEQLKLEEPKPKKTDLAPASALRVNEPRFAARSINE